MMSYTAASTSVFRIEDSDENNSNGSDVDDLADSNSNQRLSSPLRSNFVFTQPLQASPEGEVSPPEQQKLLSSTADRVAGTVGCCSAVCFLLGCLSFGWCWRELRETYVNHTLCGRWCPLSGSNEE